MATFQEPLCSSESDDSEDEFAAVEEVPENSADENPENLNEEISENLISTQTSNPSKKQSVNENDTMVTVTYTDSEGTFKDKDVAVDSLSLRKPEQKQSLLDNKAAPDKSAPQPAAPDKPTPNAESKSKPSETKPTENKVEITKPASSSAPTTDHPQKVATSIKQEKDGLNLTHEARESTPQTTESVLKQVNQSKKTDAKPETDQDDAKELGNQLVSDWGDKIINFVEFISPFAVQAYESLPRSMSEISLPAVTLPEVSLPAVTLPEVSLPTITISLPSMSSGKQYMLSVLKEAHSYIDKVYDHNAAMCIFGILLALFGGSFPICIAVWSAIQIGGLSTLEQSWAAMCKEMEAVYKEVQTNDSIKDILDTNNDGVVDLSEMLHFGFEFLKGDKKVKSEMYGLAYKLFAAIEPVEMHRAMSGFYTVGFSVLATLQSTFARQFTTGIQIGQLVSNTFQTKLGPKIGAMIPEDYKKWAPSMMGWGCSAFGLMISFPMYWFHMAGCWAWCYSVFVGYTMVMDHFLAYAETSEALKEIAKALTTNSVLIKFVVIYLCVLHQWEILTVAFLFMCARIKYTLLTETTSETIGVPPTLLESDIREVIRLGAQSAEPVPEVDPIRPAAVSDALEHPDEDGMALLMG